MNVLRYLSDPMSRKREADPANKIMRDTKTLTIMPEISSLCRRFLRVSSVSRRYSLRMDFTSLSNK